MNLVTMLQTKIAPAVVSKHRPKRVMETTEARYKDVLSGDWLTSVEVSAYMGMAYRTAEGTLRRYLKKGLVERRPRGGKFTNRHGWEYRWV